MISRYRLIFLISGLMILISVIHLPASAVSLEKLTFDHNYTFAETVNYLNEVVTAYPDICRLLTIGKSYMGKDLLVLEITNHRTGKAEEKPGYWFDGNLHASEVMGAAVCLKTIETIVSGYGQDETVTDLVDTRTLYIMPKFNPDGSDYYLTHPDSMRSSVRPHDSDRDGVKDDDPPEDLNGDGYITLMRIRDELGGMKTSPDDPRLMSRRAENEKGEWRVYSEGIDNDNDGNFNEDGVGGLDINRNWPSRWQPEHVQRGAGLYPLSEPETRAVAEFLFSHSNITGIVNHHMAGNFLYRPPTNRWLSPFSGEEEYIPRADESLYQTFSRKYSEILNKQPVRKVMGRSEPPTYGAIFGVMIGWAYDHLGVFSWVPEMGSLAPFCDYDKDGRATEAEQLRWNDEKMNGAIFMDWKPYDHPQLGKVEIGGFTGKILNPKTKTYTSLMCTPGPKYMDFLEKHAQWNLYLASMSPLIRITNIEIVPGKSDYYKITAQIQNQGYLPTNVTQHAIDIQAAGTVKASIELNGASLFGGKEVLDLGHLPGTTPSGISPVKEAEWIVSRDGDKAAAVITVTSEKGGTVRQKINLK